MDHRNRGEGNEHTNGNKPSGLGLLTALFSDLRLMGDDNCPPTVWRSALLSLPPAEVSDGIRSLLSINQFDPPNKTRPTLFPFNSFHQLHDISCSSPHCYVSLLFSLSCEVKFLLHPLCPLLKYISGYPLCFLPPVSSQAGPLFLRVFFFCVKIATSDSKA